MDLEEYVDFKYEYLDTSLMEDNTTGSSLNTSVKTLTTNTYDYPVEINVELVYGLISCFLRFGCRKTFEL